MTVGDRAALRNLGEVLDLVLSSADRLVRA